MYHFTAAHTTNTFENVVLTNKQTVEPHLIQCLRPFQLEAVRFLDKHLSKGDFCVLNDESGLGKSAVVSVLLGIHANSKKCLIVVQNQDENVDNWEFHLSVLTQLQVTVIRNNKDTTETPHNVYIAKWTTIRNIADLSKFKFDLIIVDNRDDTLCNNFCTSMLMKLFERKVNMVVSSVDITCDIKLLHNILRLGGRLEPRFENFKVFQEKFQLPAATDANNKKQLDLEFYFRKRAMLADLVNDFRLRRYRHQYDECLPLVSEDTYALNVKNWREEMNAKHKPIIEQVVVLSSDSGSTIGTEQMLAQVAALSAKTVPCVQVANKAMPTICMETHFEPIDASEEPVVMSPLLFVSDSETDEEVHVPKPTPPKTGTVIAIISSSESNEAVELPTLSNDETALETNEPKNESSDPASTPKRNAAKIKGKSACEAGEKAQKEKIAPPKSQQSTKEDGIESVEAKVGNSRAGKRKILESNNAPVPKRGRTKLPTDELEPKENSKPVTRKERPKADEPKEKHAKAGRPKNSRNKKQRVHLLEIAPKGVHTRQTRGMQRLTRSSDTKLNSKYLSRSLALIIDGTTAGTKPKKKVQNSKVGKSNNNNNNSNSKTKASDKDEENNKTKKDTNKTNTKDSNKVNKKDKIKTNRKAEKKVVEQQKTSQTSIVFSPDYEDIQCGQKLECNTEYDMELQGAGDKKLRKGDEFVTPAPRSTQYSMLLTNFTEPDLMIVSPPVQRGNNKSDIIILSSSLDESSVSSECSRRTRALKLKKTAANQSVNAQHKQNLASFAEVLNKQNRCKSPDLFSNYSDAINCTQSTPNEHKINETVRPFDGFKIFGSEVKQYQQQYASQRRSAAASGVAGKQKHERSCLDILEKMFEPRAGDAAGDSNNLPDNKTNKSKATTGTAATPRLKPKRNIVPQLPSDAIERNNAEQAKKEKLQKSANGAANKSGKTRAQKTMPGTAPTTKPIELATTADDEEIFEITNNATFGSMLRVNTNGDVTPVPQTQAAHKPTQPNKITKYFSGLLPMMQTQTKLQRTLASTPILATPPDDEQLDATGKRTQQQQSGGNVRKSPKSPKNQMQTTKLTRWLLKNNGDSNDTPTTAATDKYPTPATTPSNAANERAQKLTRRTAKNRRRLDMFK